ncbi:hypothetical protein V6N12_051411 [Hibiscus sabdariffa]|uniref:Uncharacterized protein n=1 Tax=Hibiscus sabdariffa TaxID=183260 RepID=A0ABR2GF87_9ROSI
MDSSFLEGERGMGALYKTELVDYFSGSLGVVDGNVEKFPDGLIQEILGCGVSESMKSGLPSQLDLEEDSQVENFVAAGWR